jgi:hypothetical protein
VPRPHDARALAARTICALVLALASLTAAPPAMAQEPDDQFEAARFRFGPLRFTPVIEITSLGHDSNVFNEDGDPKGDMTAAVGPGVQLWMRPGGSHLRARLGGQYLYFKEFAGERAWNVSNEGRWEVPLARLRPFVAGSYVNARERTGYEIDSRARRRENSVSLGTGLRVSGRTALELSVHRFNAKYDDEEVYLGTPLAAVLDRREEAARVQLRYALTPLTTLVVNTEVARDRFTTARIRDTDSLRILPGFELKPFALISGRVFVGYRRFEPADAALPGYRGVVAAVDATYVRGATRFVVDVERDLAYSYQAQRPYYALLDAGLTVTQRVAERWELIGRSSRQSLAYRQLDVPGAPADPGTDRGFIHGGGLGYRAGDALRLGFDINYQTRQSEIEERRAYDGLRLFGSISYGIRQ